jgi:hypothetical protein
LVAKHPFTGVCEGRPVKRQPKGPGGRCRHHRRDGSPDGERMWHEVEKARYELKGEETMKFFVPANEGHDDYLMSLALCCHAAQAAAPPAESAVIRPRESSVP